MYRAGALLLALTLPACERTHAPTRADVISPEPPSVTQPTVPSPSTPHTVLAELYTSEGCSSCPPADEVLATLDRDLAPHGLITLSFHVDYWNDLGWPDPFSSPLYTARQRTYATHFGERGVYTPQLVIAGREAFVGSDATRAREAIRAQLQQTPIPIHLEATRESPTSIRLHWSIPTTPPNTRLHLAAVTPAATTTVRRGENAGRNLSHIHVVRALDSATATETEGNRVLTATSPTNLIAVAWLQAPDLSILGATRASPD